MEHVKDIFKGQRQTKKMELLDEKAKYPGFPAICCFFPFSTRKNERGGGVNSNLCLPAGH